MILKLKDKEGTVAMKVKLLAVLFAMSALFIGAVLWRMDRFVFSDRMSWVEAQNRTQIGSMNQALAVELKSFQRVFSTLTTESFKKEQFNWSAIEPFYAAASFLVNNGSLELQILLTKDNSRAAGWNSDFLTAVFNKLSVKNKGVSIFVTPFQDSTRKRFVSILFVEGNRAYALFGNGEIFQSMIDAEKGSLSSFAIVNSLGQTVAHSTPEYLGTSMSDDPFFKEAQKSSLTHGAGIYKLAGGNELYGMFEQVPRSNIFLISSVPVADMMQGRRGLWWQFLLLGCGLVLFSSAGVLWAVSPAEREIGSLEKQLKEVMLMAARHKLPEKTVNIDPKAAQEEKIKTSTRVASALAHEMSGPLTSILGYSQMILAKNPEKEITDNTDSILREARVARGIIEKVLIYAGEDIQVKNYTKIEGPLARALKNLESVFHTKGVKLVKKFESSTPIDLQIDALSRAFENILVNSIEAMERMAKKEIHINLTEDEQFVRLTIEDTGEGIDPENLQKIFDPFFTTRSFQNHMGLGLSVAFGVLREHHAEMVVSSERAHGTKVQILFKKINSELNVNESTQIMEPSPSEHKAEESVEEFIAEMNLPLPRESEPGSLPSESIPQEIPQIQIHTGAVAALDFEQSHSERTASPLDMNIENLLEFPAIQEPFKHFEAQQTAQDIQGLDGNEIKPKSYVQLPKTEMLTAASVSKLDGYHVDIRKPGKRN